MVDDLGHGPLRCDLNESDRRSLWVLMRSEDRDGGTSDRRRKKIWSAPGTHRRKAADALSSDHSDEQDSASYYG